jgi:hypothetical protein
MRTGESPGNDPMQELGLVAACDALPKAFHGLPDFQLA